MTLIVIPDVHGHLAELQKVVQRADAAASPEAQIVFLGDLVDRGPDSRGVIQFLLDGIAAGRDWIVLRGNHDQMFLDAVLGPQSQDATGRGLDYWLRDNLGGRDTLRSYGIDPGATNFSNETLIDMIPQAHLRFLGDAPLQYETADLFVAHAGVRPGVPFSAQTDEDLLWIREPFLSDQRDHGKLVVHGHTAIRAPKHYGNRINLDGGAGWGRPLHVAMFEGRRCWLLGDAGPSELLPERSL